MIANNIDLQDNRLWKRMYKSLMDLPQGSLTPNVNPREYVDYSFPPCHDLQDQTFQPSSYFNYFISDASGLVLSKVVNVIIGDVRVESPLSFSSPTAFDFTPVPGVSTAGAGIFLHFKEPDLWARLSEAPAVTYLGKITWNLTYSLRSHANKTIDLQNGWHVDKVRIFNWSMAEIYKIWRNYKYPPGIGLSSDYGYIPGDGSPFQRGRSTNVVIRCPRIFRNTTDRWWLSSPMELYYGLDFGHGDLGYYWRRPARAGMKAVSMSYTVDYNAGTLTWYQNLNVHQFNGKIWVPMKEVHGQRVLPDVIDSTSVDPNFQYDLVGYIDPQSYFGNTFYNSLGL